MHSLSVLGLGEVYNIGQTLCKDGFIYITAHYVNWYGTAVDIGHSIVFSIDE